jgi:hypothetical protein
MLIGTMGIGWAGGAALVAISAGAQGAKAPSYFRCQFPCQFRCQSSFIAVPQRIGAAPFYLYVSDI